MLELTKGGTVMNEAITFSISDILWLAGAIVAIASAAGVLAGTIDRLRRPSRAQDARLDELEKRMARDQKRLSILEDGMTITQRALLALLAHGIDGNDVEAMKKAKQELTDFLIER